MPQISRLTQHLWASLSSKEAAARRHGQAAKEGAAVADFEGLRCPVAVRARQSLHALARLLHALAQRSGGTQGGGGGVTQGGGGVASGTVQRLQEELIINTQKTENELDRMSEYLDKMSEQLASLWEQKANISEVSTLRADVDALLGQREGDVMQIKDVLSTMESSLRNPSLPSTASSSRGRSGGVQGVLPRR